MFQNFSYKIYIYAPIKIGLLCTRTSKLVSTAAANGQGQAQCQRGFRRIHYGLGTSNRAHVLTCNLTTYLSGRSTVCYAYNQLRYATVVRLYLRTYDSVYYSNRIYFRTYTYGPGSIHFFEEMHIGV